MKKYFLLIFLLNCENNMANKDLNSKMPVNVDINPFEFCSCNLLEEKYSSEEYFSDKDKKEGFNNFVKRELNKFMNAKKIGDDYGISFNSNKKFVPITISNNVYSWNKEREIVSEEFRLDLSKHANINIKIVAKVDNVGFLGDFNILDRDEKKFKQVEYSARVEFVEKKRLLSEEFDMMLSNIGVEIDILKELEDEIEGYGYLKKGEKVSLKKEDVEKIFPNREIDLSKVIQKFSVDSNRNLIAHIETDSGEREVLFRNDSGSKYFPTDSIRINFNSDDKTEKDMKKISNIVLKRGSNGMVKIDKIHLVAPLQFELRGTKLRLTSISIKSSSNDISH